MKKLNLLALLLGAALFLGFGASTASAEGMKCGAGKCGKAMAKNAMKNCNDKNCGTTKDCKCGEDCKCEKGAAIKTSKSGTGKCGAQMKAVKKGQKCGAESMPVKKAGKCGKGKCS